MYVYDVEIFRNFFSVIFLKVGDPNVAKYIEADINKDKQLKDETLKLIEHEKYIIFHDVFGDNIGNRNDLVKLRKFLFDNRDSTFIGYNNKHYDDYVLSYISNYSHIITVQDMTKNLFALSQELVHYDGYNFTKDSSYNVYRRKNSIDLMKLNYLDKLKISLKQVSIALKWYRVEEYAMPDATEDELSVYKKYFHQGITLDSVNKLKSFDRIIKYSHIEGVMEYNFNDVFVTDKLYSHSKKELIERINIFEEFGVNVLSDSRSGSADKVLAKLYGDYTGLKYMEFANLRTFRKVINIGKLIVSNVAFKTDELKSFLGTLASKKLIVGEDKFEEIILFNNVGYTVAMGGLHSIDKGGVFTSTDKVKYVEFDVNSFYPALVTVYGFKPKHLSSIVLKLLDDLMQVRLDAKASGDNKKADVLKILINSVYGKGLPY